MLKRMKEKPYEQAELTVTFFEGEDIVTASGDPGVMDGSGGWDEN